MHSTRNSETPTLRARTAKLPHVGEGSKLKTYGKVPRGPELRKVLQQSETQSCRTLSLQRAEDFEYVLTLSTQTLSEPGF